nr:MAG TPA: hypothetical protein [Caudoviricetes sp.]
MRLSMIRLRFLTNSFLKTTVAITISPSGFWVWNANGWLCCGGRIYA